ncbi:MAG: nuclear transport factor 2 family protein [Chitinophaga sp.]|uniref:YybH family protein n=1 Tax=Chitinophaga sp. TaxID=1869181 RepID=UPI001B17E43E|nr:nuclear transport factor 2 family protein [Chitinophaga sp.]MBO9727140.1 nuclear transport factor 2 family protein [Chitinophaga sp.]
MRFILFLMLLGATAGVPAQAQQAPSGDQQKITALMTAQTTAWNNGDIEGFMQTYWHSDSLLFVGKSGITYGWQATLDRYKKTYPDATTMGKLDFKLLEFKPLAANVYLLVGKWHLQRSIGDLEGHFSLILKKIKGEWKIIEDHTS